MAISGPTEAHLGIVLGSRNVGEAHRIVQLFTPDAGRLEIWAPQARASKRRFLGALEPFATVRLQLVRRSQGLAAVGAEVAMPRAQLRMQLLPLGRASALCRLVTLLWPAEQPAPVVYNGLRCALDHLEAGRVARAAGLYPRLLAWSGLTPLWTACCLCGAETQSMGAVPEAPGPVCSACRPGARMLGPALRAALEGGRIEHEALAQEVEHWIVLWSGWHLGQQLRLLHRPPA